DGPARSSLEKLMHKQGLDKYVKFVGKVDESTKLKLYQQSWIFVNPSLLEGWGITTIEANACGTPVVASRVPGLCDAVVPNKSGLLVPYGDPSALSEAINAILNNNKLRDKLTN